MRPQFHPVMQLLSVIFTILWTPILLLVADDAQAKTDPAETARFIDREIDQCMSVAQFPASPTCSDAEFLRRLTLDLLGTIPAREQVVAFLADTDLDKRAQLIDETLDNPRFGTRMADLWFRRLIPESNIKNRVPKELLHQWLQESFQQNRPWDQIVYELLTPTAPQIVDRPAMLWMLNDGETLKPEEAADLASPLFLGITIRCAQCHDHPFTKLTQDDFWGMAGFFNRLVRDGQGVASTRGLTEGTNPRLQLPPFGKTAPVKFLGGSAPDVAADAPRLPLLAEWITSPENPYFAKAIVNRAWEHMMGMGIVNPVDDMQPERLPTHPKLLDGLAARFVASGFDLKFLYRAIALSQVYQRSSVTVAGNADDSRWYSHKPVKVLSPAELYSSLQTLTVINPHAEEKDRARFISFFKAGDDPLEYDRGIPQLLRMMNAPLLAKQQSQLVKQLKASGEAPESIIQTLFLAVLGRQPSEQERSSLLAFVQRTEVSPEIAYGDVLWALINCSEFNLNR